jgi:multidrug resistance efflux pump
MDLLIIMTYAAFAYGCFKVFKIPVNKWTVPTAILGGVFIVAGLILTMNYNHPYTFMAQKAVITVPVIPQVSGTVSEVLVTPNLPVKAGSVLFKIDPTIYQARVDRLTADLVKAEQQVKSQQAQLTASQSEVEKAAAERDRAQKDLNRYQRAAGSGQISKPVHRTRGNQRQASVSGPRGQSGNSPSTTAAGAESVGCDSGRRKCLSG